MAADLLKVFLYGTPDGELCQERQRRVLCIVDGIVGGEGDGPILPDEKRAGCLVGGENPLAVDLVCARLMGFDPAKIPQFELLREPQDFDFGLREAGEVNVLAEDAAVRGLFQSGGSFLDFAPHPGWRGRVEINS